MRGLVEYRQATQPSSVEIVLSDLKLLYQYKAGVIQCEHQQHMQRGHMTY